MIARGLATCGEGGGTHAWRADRPVGIIEAPAARFMARREVLSKDFMAAVRGGDLGAVERGLVEGVDPNGRDAQGERPLCVAVDRSRPRMVELLLGRGADPRLANDAGFTPALRSMVRFLRPELRKSQRAIRELLEGAGASFEDQPLVDLWQAVCEGDRARTEALLAADVPADGPPFHLLSCAATSGSPEVTRALIEAGAQVDQVHERATPLMRAIRAGYLPVVKVLIAAGASVHCLGPYENIGLFAYMSGHPEVTRWIERHTGLDARYLVRVEVRPGERPPSWDLFISETTFGNAYSMVFVEAPIDEASPAIRHAQGATRLLIGIDTDPQWVLIYERPSYVIQLVDCPWTVFVHNLGDPHRVGEADTLAKAVSLDLGCRAIFIGFYDTAEEERCCEYHCGRKVRSATDDDSMVTHEGIRMPALDGSMGKVILVGVERKDIVRVDAITRDRRTT